jgi:hypothetical protein
VVVLGLVPTMRSALEADRLEDIIAVYDEIKTGFPDHNDPARTARIEILLLRINNFMASFPNSRELERVQEMHREFSAEDEYM